MLDVNSSMSQIRLAITTQMRPTNNTLVDLLNDTATELTKSLLSTNLRDKAPVSYQSTTQTARRGCLCVDLHAARHCITGRVLFFADEHSLGDID